MALWFVIITIVTTHAYNRKSSSQAKLRTLDIVYNAQVIKCFEAKGDKTK